MFRRRLAIVTALSLIVVVFTVPQDILAQDNNVCTATIAEALTQTVVNCANNETGAVCYGFPEIESVLQDDIDVELFDEPGDTVDAIDVITLRPGPINTVDETWGIVVMNLQASLPKGSPEDVVVIALGGAEIESDVPEEEAFIPLEVPVTLTTNAAGELREVSLTPPQLAEELEQVPSGSTVLADAVSEDAEWIRVVYADQPGWLSVGALAGQDLSDLPTIDDGQLTAMQAFYLRTGIENGNCAPKSSWVLVQGPEETAADLIFYDVHMRVEATMLLRTLPPGEPVGPQMELIVTYGVVTINPDTPDEIIVPAGYSLLMGLGPDFVSLGIEGDEDERSGPITFGEPTLLTQSQLDDLSIIGQIPPDIFNYDAPPPLLFTASGVGGPIIDLIFPDPGALTPIQELCAAGALSPAICSIYGFPTP